MLEIDDVRMVKRFMDFDLGDQLSFDGLIEKCAINLLLLAFLL